MMGSLFAKDRLEITGWLEVVTPLHIGSGHSSPDSRLPANDQGAFPETRDLLVDGSGAPYIPGSSIKGVLKALVAGQAGADKLFGSSHGDDDGHMGALTLYGATFASPATSSTLPYFENRHATGIVARTAIDADTGTAKDNQLFHEKKVAAGARFAFKACIDAQHEQTLLGPLLKSMHDGFSLGADTGTGSGRVRLVEARFEVYGIDPVEGTWVRKHAAPTLNLASFGPLPPTGRRIQFTLQCDGPYIVNDAAWQHELDQMDKQARKALPKLKALGWRGDEPKCELPGTSLKGVLRSRSLFLERCAGGDSALTDRLFGTPDSAAALQMRRIDCTNTPTRTVQTSVKLDRFSAAPIETALYSAECWVGAEFAISLCHELDDDSAACAHLKRLLQDVAENGLILGHGGGHGFGWFRSRGMDLR
jgi:CRISPR/Cas system CSM-associated protein Csm3 (group 7 of RAMP superfamily)